MSTVRVLSPAAKRVLQLAQQDAIAFNHEYVGVEHLLLGLMRECRLAGTTSYVASVLQALDVDPQQIIASVDKVVKAGIPAVIMGKLPHTPRLKKAIDYANSCVSPEQVVDTEHLLLGLLNDVEGIAVSVLKEFGITTEVVTAELTRLKEQVENVPLRLSPEVKQFTKVLAMAIAKRHHQEVEANMSDASVTPAAEEEEVLVILLSDQAPVRIKTADWPIMGKATLDIMGPDGQNRRTWTMVARAPESNTTTFDRILVYALYDAFYAGTPARNRSTYAGVYDVYDPKFFDDPGLPQTNQQRAVGYYKRVAMMIRHVATESQKQQHDGNDAARWSQMANECIWNLPIQDLT